MSHSEVTLAIDGVPGVRRAARQELNLPVAAWVCARAPLFRGTRINPNAAKAFHFAYSRMSTNPSAALLNILAHYRP
jgi:hypothetical protein